MKTVQFIASAALLAAEAGSFRPLRSAQPDPRA